MADNDNLCTLSNKQFTTVASNSTLLDLNQEQLLSPAVLTLTGQLFGSKVDVEHTLNFV